LINDEFSLKALYLSEMVPGLFVFIPHIISSRETVIGLWYVILCQVTKQ